MRLPFLTVRTRSPEETIALGEQVGSLVRPGEVLLLSGELGTGKTTFTKGVARGLGVPGEPTSPTFTMMRPHEGGRYPFMHIDLFRCESPLEVLELGIEEVLEPPWVVAVEWGEKAFPVVADDYLEIEFEWDDDEADVRTVRFRPFGRWRERMGELGESVRRWAGTGNA